MTTIIVSIVLGVVVLCSVVVGIFAAVDPTDKKLVWPFLCWSLGVLGATAAIGLYLLHAGGAG